MSAPLTHDQKRILSQLARRAFNRELALARGRGEKLAELSEESFRHQQVARATGKAGLRCCTQDDYGAVKACFLDLLGQSGQAFQAVHHGQGNARRVAEYKLVQACETARLPLSYAAKVCASQFRCTLEDASEKQLWCLTFTINNRGRKVAVAKEVTA
jgi:uncharacterized protein YifE (UPF0438 family)